MFRIKFWKRKPVLGKGQRVGLCKQIIEAGGVMKLGDRTLTARRYENTGCFALLVKDNEGREAHLHLNSNGWVAHAYVLSGRLPADVATELVDSNLARVALVKGGVK